MRIALICHEEDELNRKALPRWLASFSTLAGIVSIRETPQRLTKRIKREIKRVGWLRFIDVLLFRAYYKIRLSAKDRRYQKKTVDDIAQAYPEIPDHTPVLLTHSPNTDEVADFLRRQAPDILIARCKAILNRKIFSIPPQGTFVMHPGICPEYRNAHGCFWALANRDLDKVGTTLLRIDEGVDTGPVYGYYSYDYDEWNESHIVISHRTVFDNLDQLQAKLLEIGNSTAEPISTEGRQSAAWGQPWMSKYVSWKLQARAARK